VPAVEIIALIASIVELARSTGDAAGFLRREAPVYGLFWKDFERRIAKGPGVPWQAIHDGSYLQPDFIGWAWGAVIGDAGSRDLLRKHLEAIVRNAESNGPDGVDEVVARVLLAADEAAAEAAKSDRQAIAASRRILEERLEVLRLEIAARTGEIKEIAIDIKKIVSRLDAQPTVPQLDEDSLQALIDAQLVEVDDDKVRLRDNYVEHARFHTAAIPSPTEATNPLLTPPARGVPGDSDARMACRTARWIRSLEQVSAAEAGRLQQILEDHGPDGIAEGLAEGKFDARPVEFLVAAARILADRGQTEMAKQAHLLGAKLAVDDRTKARQLVRASYLARAAGAAAAADELVDRAETLDPELPAVCLARSRQALDDDPRHALKLLKEVEGESDLERVNIHGTRCQAHLLLGENAAARHELEQGVAADDDECPDDSLVELKALLTWLEATEAVSRGAAIDTESLMEAGTAFAALAFSDRAAAPSQVARLASRAAEALMLAGAHEQAAATARQAAEARDIDEDAALAVGEALLATNQPRLALDVLPSAPVTPFGKVALAEARLRVKDYDAAVEQLRALMDGDDLDVARAAAFALASSASVDPDLEWDQQAAAIVEGHKPHIARGLLAERHHTLGDVRAAEEAMLPNVGGTAALRRLRDYAVELEEWDKVKDRASELVRRANDPRDRLSYADALVHLGELETAERELFAIARDDGIEGRLRDAAFTALADLVGRDYVRILEISREWQHELPDSDNAPWNHVFALARLSRHDEALAAARNAKLDPTSEQRATLLAEVLHRAAPPDEAVRQISALSDRFDRKVEALEALVVATALSAEQDGGALPDELTARVRETLIAFPERFPDSTTIRLLPAPKTVDEWHALVERQVGDGPELYRQFGEQVTAGQGPVNLLAVAGGDGVGAAWGRLDAMPLSFGPGPSAEADLDAARVALGGAAVLDPSSVHALGLTGQAVEAAALSALPGSLIAQETLEDADSDDRTAGRGSAETVHDTEGGWAIREISQAERDEEQRRVQDAMRLARSMTPLPATAPRAADSPATEDLARRYSEEVPPALKTMLATLLVAAQAGRPVYSDDRWIREFARALGLRAFGSIALISALREREMITDDARRDARLALAARRGWGVGLTASEMTAASREHGFALTDALTGGFQDRAVWRAAPTTLIQEALEFLSAAFDESPGSIDTWVFRLIDAAQMAIPEAKPGWATDPVLALAWLGQGSDEFFQAVVEATKNLPVTHRSLGEDPVIKAMRLLVGHLNESELTEEQRIAQFRFLASRLRAPDQFRVFQFFLR
jgi:hypothetical protein